MVERFDWQLIECTGRMVSVMLGSFCVTLGGGGQEVVGSVIVIVLAVRVTLLR